MPDSEKAWAFLRDSDLITSAAEVQAAVDRLAAEIERELGKRYPLVLAVMGGAVVFAGQILPRLHFPLDFDYVHASRYGAATRGAGIEWRVRPSELVKGRAVLVLDDIPTTARPWPRPQGLLGLGAETCTERSGGETRHTRNRYGGFRRLAHSVRFVSVLAWTRRVLRNLPEIRSMKQ